MMRTKKLIAAMMFAFSMLQGKAQTSLDGYIDIALKNNPALRSYQYQSKSLQQKVKPSRVWEDPMLMVGIMNLPTSFSFTEDMMTMKQIGIQQNFSVGKKYSLKSSVAQKEFEASQYDIQVQQLLLIYKIKEQYYDLYAQKKGIETTENSIDVMKNYISIANSRYSTGQGTQQDVLKAQLELSKMQNELLKIQSMLGDMTAAFNTLLARDKMGTIDIPEKLDFLPVTVEMDSLFALADSSNPMLLQAKTNLSRDSATYQLEKTSTIPDFNAGFWYGQRQALMPDGSKASDMLGFSFGLTLPVFSKSKQKPLISAAAISIQQSQAQLASLKNETELMVHHAMTDINKNQKLISLYERQLLPQATENLNSGIIGYQENKIDFMTLTDNFISLYNYRLQYYQAITDYMKAVAELEMLTGKNLISQQ